MAMAATSHYLLAHLQLQAANNVQAMNVPPSRTTGAHHFTHAHQVTAFGSLQAPAQQQLPAPCREPLSQPPAAQMQRAASHRQLLSTHDHQLSSSDTSGARPSSISPASNTVTHPSHPSTVTRSAPADQLRPNHQFAPDPQYRLAHPRALQLHGLQYRSSPPPASFAASSPPPVSHALA